MRYEIKRTNGSAEWLIASVSPTGKQSKKAMGENVVDFSFTLPKYIDFKLMDFVLVYGERYQLNVLPSVKKVAKNSFEYNMQLEAVFYDLAKVQLQFLNSQNQLLEPSFTLMGNAGTIVGLIVENANRHSAGWSVGIVDDTGYKNFTFNAENCLQGLNRLAQEFETEFWIENKTIHLQKREQSSGMSFGYGQGKGLYSILRGNNKNINIVTRLYVRGSAQNLPAGYRNSSGNLLLPGGQTYFEDPAKIALYGMIEASQVFDVKPEREGIVSTIVSGNGNWKFFTDNTLDFDLNAVKLDVPSKVRFNTGQLAGYSFEITAYNAQTRQLTIKKNEEEKSIEMPSDVLRPAIGDKYVLVDIAMPESYVSAAENRLKQAALTYYEKNSDPALNFAYTIDCDPIWFKQLGVKVTLGNTVTITDTDMGINGEIRIAAYKRDLQSAFKYEFEVTDSIGANEIIRQYAQQQRTLQLIESSGLLDINQIRKNIFLNRLSEQDGYLMLSGTKTKAGVADYAPESGHALKSDYAKDSDQWDGRQFDDFINQPLRKTDAVTFLSVVADTVNSKGYVSGFTGTGYKINPDGSAEFDKLTVRKELNVSVLNVREITGSGGSIAVTNVAKIKAVTEHTDYWSCQIDTDDNTIAVQFRVNDIVRCQVWDGKRLKYYSGRVKAVSAGIFDLDKASITGGGIPAAGDSVFQFGNTTDTNRQGLIYLTNSDTGAPYIDVLDGINSDSLAGKTKVRLGKLSGISDADLGELDGYGLYADRAFIKGKIIVTGGNAETTAGAQVKADKAEANASKQADKALKNLYDGTFTNGRDFWAISGYGENPPVIQLGTIIPGRGITGGNVFQFTGHAWIYAKNAIPVDHKRTYELTLRIRCVQDNTPGKFSVIYCGVSQQYADYTTPPNVGNHYFVVSGRTLSASEGWVVFKGRFTTENFYDDKIASLRPLVGVNYTEGDSIVEIDSLIFEDITAASSAKTAAVAEAGVYAEEIAKSKADVAKAAAISAASDDAKLKADTAYSKAVDSANIYAKTVANSAASQAEVNAAADALNKANNAYNTAVAAANLQYSNLTASLKTLAYQDVVELSKLGNTVIEGGRVKTTLLDAAWIQANVVTAQYIDTLELDAAKISIKGGGRKNLLFPDRLKPSQGEGLANADFEQFTQYLNGTLTQNRIEFGTDPFGKSSLMWKCIENTNTRQQSGGFHTLVFPVDGLKAYRFSFSFYKIAGGAGNVYLGCSQQTTADIGGGYNANPYFANTAQLDDNKWYLAIGYLMPQNETVQRQLSGFYSYETGKKVIDGLDYRSAHAGISNQYMRAYQYYASAGRQMYIYNPIVELIDGSESSINTLLGRDAQTLAIAQNAQNAADTANGSISALKGSLGKIAYQDKIDLAKLDNTIIEGGYIKTSLIEVSSLIANGNLETTTGAQIKATEAQRYADGKSYMNGRMLFRDPDFRLGLNGISVYNNYQNGTVTVEHLTREQWGNELYALPTNSPYGVRIRSNGSATPGTGGFCFANATRANAKFVTRILAFIPVGYSLGWHSNPFGDNGTAYWTTPVAGTGSWQEYIVVVKCGTTGTFSSTNFFALSGAPNVEWYIASATVYDVTDTEIDYKLLADQAQNTANMAKGITDNFTVIEGGLISTNTLKVGTLAQTNAGITGVTDAGVESVRIWAGGSYENRYSANFQIRDNGRLIASNAEISGKVMATTGNIGALRINQSGLTAGSENTWAANSQSIVFNPSFTLLRHCGSVASNTISQTRELSFGLGYYPASSGIPDNHTVVIKNNIRNAYGGTPPFPSFRQRNVALRLEARDSDENIALEIGNGRVYLNDVWDVNETTGPLKGYIKAYYRSDMGKYVLVLDDNRPHLDTISRS